MKSHFYTVNSFSTRFNDEWTRTNNEKQQRRDNKKNCNLNSSFEILITRKKNSPRVVLENLFGIIYYELLILLMDLLKTRIKMIMRVKIMNSQWCLIFVGFNWNWSFWKWLECIWLVNWHEWDGLEDIFEVMLMKTVTKFMFHLFWHLWSSFGSILLEHTQK